jgi:hypothetical protein
VLFSWVRRLAWVHRVGCAKRVGMVDAQGHQAVNLVAGVHSPLPAAVGEGVQFLLPAAGVPDSPGSHGSHPPGAGCVEGGPW